MVKGLAAGGALGVLAGGAGRADDEHIAAFAAVGGVGRHGGNLGVMWW